LIYTLIVYTFRILYIDNKESTWATKDDISENTSSDKDTD